MNVSRNFLIVLIVLVFAGGAGTAFAGVVLPTITLAGNVDILGELTCTDCIDSADIQSSAVGSSEIAANAVGFSELKPDTIGSSEIAANAVGSSEIAANAVGSSEIAANAVGSSEIAANAVGESELVPGSAVKAITRSVTYSAEASTSTIVTQTMEPTFNPMTMCFLTQVSFNSVTTSGTNTWCSIVNGGANWELQARGESGLTLSCEAICIAWHYTD